MFFLNCHVTSPRSSIFAYLNRKFEKLSERNPHCPNNPNICASNFCGIFTYGQKLTNFFRRDSPSIRWLQDYIHCPWMLPPSSRPSYPSPPDTASKRTLEGSSGSEVAPDARKQSEGLRFCDGNVILPDVRVLLLGGGFNMFFLRTFIPRTWENDPIWSIFFSMGFSNHQLERLFFRKLQRTGLSEVCWLILPAWLPASEIPQTS